MLKLPVSFVLNKKKTTIITLSLLLIFLGSFGLGEIGLKVPVLGELFGFISIVFIPGTLILAFLKPDNVKKTEGFLYIIGVSLFLLMALGLFANAVYPWIGIENPISEKPLIATLCGAIFLLITLFYFRVKDFHYVLNLKKLFSPIVLALLLIPFLSALGASLVNAYSNNILLLILIPLLAFFPLFILHNKFPEELYPLAVFVIGLSLMYHISLIGSYMSGDFHTEFHLANIVKTNSYWDYSSLTHEKSNLLSLVIMLPTFSSMLGMSFNWIYKIILPFFSCLVPIGIYLIAQKQTNSKIAFLSAFFFMSIHHFFMGLFTVRFRIAEFFMMLLILLILSNVEKKKSAPLAILFIVSLVWSYYGVSYAFLVILLIATLILLLIRRIPGFNFKLTEKFSLNLILIYIAVLFSWYIYTADSATFGILVRIGNDMVQSWREMFTPVDQGPIDYATRQIPSLFWEIYRKLNFVTLFFIAVGGIWMLNRFRGKSRLSFPLNDAHILFSITSFIIIFIWIVHTPSLPGHGGNFSFTRLYSLLLLFLAPLCIIGGLKFFEYGAKFAKLALGRANIDNKNHLLYPLAVFFMIFLLFSSNFVMEVGNGYSYSKALSKDRVMNGENIQNKLSINSITVNKQDVYAGKWLSKNHKPPSTIHGPMWIFETYVHPKGLSFKYLLPPKDIVHIAPFGEAGPNYLARKKDFKSFELEKDAYIFLCKFNIEQGLMGGRGLWWKTKYLYPLIRGKNKIYANGGSVIYK